MADSLVSIIVPVYNVENYISDCVESIQKQTYKNIQIILVDDGSTDQSGVLCETYAEKDERIKVIHQSNGGPVAARGHGLEYAEGEYIGFVDSDDYVEPDMYQSLINKLEASKADFVHSGYWENGLKRAANMEGIFDLSCRKKKLRFLDDMVLGVDYNISPSIWSKLFKANLIKKCHMQISKDIMLGEDLINLCICVLESNRVALTDEAYYHYRMRKDSLAHKGKLCDLKNTVKMYEGLCSALNSYGYYQELERTMDKLLWDSLLGHMDRVSSCFQMEKYFFKDVEVLKGKKIVVYGAGRVGRDYYSQLCRYTECRVVAWVDACPERYNYPHIRLNNINNLDSMKFDLLVIAVKDAKTAGEIREHLIARGIESKRICWSEPEPFMPNV